MDPRAVTRLCAGEPCSLLLGCRAFSGQCFEAEQGLSSEGKEDSLIPGSEGKLGARGNASQKHHPRWGCTQFHRPKSYGFTWERDHVLSLV